MELLNLIVHNPHTYIVEIILINNNLNIINFEICKKI